MDIFQRQTGKVLGPQGSTIKEMQARFGVKLNIQVSDSAKSGEEGAINKLKLSGTVDAVRNARQCVTYILSGGALESYNFPQSNGGNMQNNFGMSQMNGQQQQQQQYGYGKPPVPSFGGQGQGQGQGQGSYYPPALTWALVVVCTLTIAC